MDLQHKIANGNHDYDTFCIDGEIHIAPNDECEKKWKTICRTFSSTLYHPIAC